MAYRLQVQIPVELAEAVKEAARADRRSMASWVALRLEEAVAGVARGENPHLPPDYRGALEALSLVASTSNTESCAHAKTVKRETSFGWQRFCANPDCGELVR